MKKHSIIIFVALMTTVYGMRNVFIPNVSDNEKQCGLGVQETRQFCTACIKFGQMSAESQNRHMRMKMACLSLINNLRCNQISNRFLY